MEVQVVGEDRQSEVMSILARAFADDPVMNWMSSRPGFIELLFEITVPVFMPHGLTYIAGDGRGAATWLGPDAKLSWPMNLRNMWRVVRLAGLNGTRRFAGAGMKTESFHPKDPHYYLFAIGAIPECTGQGIGSALIRQVLRRCDEEVVGAYLENSKEQNLDFYRGHGFEVIREVKLGNDAPTMWLMWRKPRQIG